MVASGRRLTDWGYNYFKGRIAVKPHKSAEVTRRRRLAAYFMGDMRGAAGGISRGGFPSCLTRGDGISTHEPWRDNMGRRALMIVQQYR